MNICSIYRPFYGATQILFDSADTILDFDAAFIDADGLRGNPNALDARIQFRRNDVSEFLSLGRTIVVFVVPFQPEVFFPIGPVRLMSSSGKKIDFKGPDYLKDFWHAVQHDMEYHAYFQPATGQRLPQSPPVEVPLPGRPFLFVHETDKPVAISINAEKGNILFMPWLRQYGNPSGERQICERFIRAFLKLNETLAPKKMAISLPDWSVHYRWAKEAELRNEFASLKSQASEIEERIKTKAVELGCEEKLKVLFTDKGDILRDTVINVFNELGVKAYPGEPGRDDITLEFKGQNAVSEVKGKKGSAAESDAAQLEKWVTGFMVEKEIKPKGILLINAFCQTPLAERTEPAFPNQMLKFSSQREHCLATTTQLLGLLLAARAQPEKRDDLVNSLFSTVGVYQQFADWKAFLTSAPITK